jgi:predicted metal-dependent peptidase
MPDTARTSPAALAPLSTAMPGYSHRGTRAIQHMVEFAPSTGGLALWVGHHDVAANIDAPIIATNGTTLFYSQAFEALPLKEQAGLVAHEVLHIALRHPQRFLDLNRSRGRIDLALYTVCADAIINSALSHLNWLTLPRSAVYLDRVLADGVAVRQPLEKSLLEWDVERLYTAIDDRRIMSLQVESTQSSPHSEDGRQASTQTPNDPVDRRQDGPRATFIRALGAKTIRDLLPDPDSDGPPEDVAEQTREWSERLLRGHTNDGAFSMLRMLIADLPRAITPWEQVLRTQLAHSLSRKPSLSWSRPSRSFLANQSRRDCNRRMPWEPGFNSSKAVPRLVVIVDVSGSVDDALMQRFATEIDAITRRQEAELVLIIGDDRVRRVNHFKAGQSNLKDKGAFGGKFTGGGGTDFTPLLEEANTHRPDLCVVLTDLDGPTRFRPRWPVIWAVPQSHAMAAAPFGRKLVLR